VRGGALAGLRTLRLAFPAPGIAGEVYAAHIALALEGARGARAAWRTSPPRHLGDARAWACRRFSESSVAPGRRHLTEALGVPVFRGADHAHLGAGLRLKNAIERAVAARGVEAARARRVVAVERSRDGFGALGSRQHRACQAPRPRRDPGDRPFHGARAWG